MKFWELVSSMILFYFLNMSYSYQDIERIASRVHRDSPSKALINELGALNMTAEELARVLDQLKLEKILMYIKKYGMQLWFLTGFFRWMWLWRELHVHVAPRSYFFFCSVKKLRERMKSLCSQLDNICSKEGFKEIKP